MTFFLQQFINGIMQGSIYSLLALGLTLTIGLLGVINFAQGQFLVLGGYTVYTLLRAGIPLIPAFFISIVVGYVIGSIIERLVFRRVQDEPIKGLLISVGLIAIGEAIFLYVWGPDSREMRSFFERMVLRVGGVSIVPDRLVILMFTLVVFLSLSIFLRYGRWGKAMRGTAQNRDAAILMGVPIGTVFNGSFATGAALGVVLGAMMGGVFYVDPFMADVPLLKGLIALIIGGPTSPLGALVGGMFLGLVEAFGGGCISSTFQDGIAFIALIIVLVLRPRGFFAGALTDRT